MCQLFIYLHQTCTFSACGDGELHIQHLYTVKLLVIFLSSDKKKYLTYNSFVSKKSVGLASFEAQLCEQMKKT